MILEKKDIWYLAVVSFLLTLLIILSFRFIQPNINDERYDKLQKQLTEHAIKQDSLENIIKENESHIYLLEYDIKQNNKKINQLDKEYAKKIDSISHFHTSNVSEYFTKRYGN